ncbi:MAG: response regulator, partial [Clostridia bacterium]|nr:response regulator [Clostridia bacterium]
VFTSSVWLHQSAHSAVEKSISPIQNYYGEILEEHGIDTETGATKTSEEYLRGQLDEIDNSLERANVVQVSLIVFSTMMLFVIYAIIQKREKQIEVEKALAEESSRAKTSFLSNMSHEIRTPMNAIIGLDNIALRDKDLSPKTREHLEKIGASAKHLLGLINDILDMSRIESGRMVLKDEEFSFREFLDQVNIIINGQCADKGLHYECDIVGKVSDYYIGDDMKLKQVLINILGNSVKFTEAPGDVSLAVGQIESADDTCTMQFRIKDTGIGMDKEYVPKIFEAFSQEDATTTNKYGGSGLGMAITKNFVEMMGGKISVESEKGVGTEFTVTVPLKKSDRSYTEEQGLALPEGLRAVVVDDDEIACEHAGYVLESIGVEIKAFVSAEEALECIKTAAEQNNPYDLLVTDYKMPGMSGRELARALRGFDGGKTMVIMLTGYNWDIVEEEAKRDGVDSILAKPLFPDSMIRAIHSLIERKTGVAVQPAEEPEGKKENLLAGRRVLMAEDVDANAEILADLLELEEVESERACNGREAVDMFASHPAGYYDLILMDVRMPLMDGLSATKEIRAMEREDARVIPIIAMTANVFEEDVERSMQAGMNAHLSKPIEPDRLYAEMEAQIKRSAG